MSKQCTSTLLMVRPVAFGYNQEAADSNAFMNAVANNSTAQEDALKRFDDFVAVLRSNGVEVIVIEDSALPHTPDSIFPNNWLSLHEDGRLCLYPMEVENRRLERRSEILTELKSKYLVSKELSLTYLEKESIFLEGTGSLVLDRKHKKAYACVSTRTHFRALEEWKKLFPEYKVVAFEALDRTDMPIYHTNVMMSVGDGLAVVCLESVTEKEELLKSLKNDGLEVLEITFGQMEHFAGNMLMVENKNGEKMMVMSSKAYCSLTGEQKEKINKFARIIHSELGLIEELGGGSARCMMAEIFLIKR
ncbi:citrulline utilization hydrolase CtlX [Jiulongibacter sp. NS-SX5]|uniref:citrulline utilization hydrolase CtlX n=1 Tax=Jiulongibacter sp. NS-SX5 TaxID=3463854 RepID=UPI004059E0CA